MRSPTVALGLGAVVCHVASAAGIPESAVLGGVHSVLCGGRLPMVTPAGGPHPYAAGNQAPEPTAAPNPEDARVELLKRDGDTCGFELGDTAKPFGCGTTARCVWNAAVSHAWCCENTIILTECNPLTTCLDSTQWKTWTTDVPAGIGYCSQADYPKCVQYIFADAPYSGFTFLQCGTAFTREVAYQTPTSTTTATTSKGSSTPISTPISSSSTPVTPVVSSSQTPASPSSGQESSPSTNIGAIVGGVVGGMAVIGLIGLALFILLRRQPRDNPQEPLPQQPTQQYYAPGPPNPQPAYTQSTPSPIAGGVTPGSPPLSQHDSMYKPPYDRSSVSSPPLSPAYPGQEFAASAGLGVQGQPPMQPQWAPQPQPQLQPQSPQPQSPVQGYPQYNGLSDANHIELPTERGDGQLRELQG